MLNRIEVLRHLIAQQRSVGLAPRRAPRQQRHHRRIHPRSATTPHRAAGHAKPDCADSPARSWTRPPVRVRGAETGLQPADPRRRDHPATGDADGRPRLDEPYSVLKEAPELPQNDEQGGLQRLPVDGSTPWQQKTPKGQDEAPGSEEGALAQLSKAGGITPTDCVMKAMDGIEGVKDIIVLRFRKGGDVEMSSTMDRMKVVGALQLAMGCLRQD